MAAHISSAPRRVLSAVARSRPWLTARNVSIAAVQYARVKMPSRRGDIFRAMCFRILTSADDIRISQTARGGATALIE